MPATPPHPLQVSCVHLLPSSNLLEIRQVDRLDQVMIEPRRYETLGALATRRAIRNVPMSGMRQTRRQLVAVDAGSPMSVITMSDGAFQGRATCRLLPYASYPHIPSNSTNASALSAWS